MEFDQKWVMRWIALIRITTTLLEIRILGERT
ncbi:hypothetical protein AciX8_2649 [Granulicella mallensis MP5ACTX8]|uniref:Uncharacterized protein n=1 Tax=Granulicella mallensis (strain ATCC BAA-1857 / DSM 23137 / MP5ACTX8) TaxID=682795 RepID=G8P135_GRAMM|nr:hypothetical protein AciX8_2649 [Granulicella mallensis MP5ACTX8]